MSACKWIFTNDSRFNKSIINDDLPVKEANISPDFDVHDYITTIANEKYQLMLTVLPTQVFKSSITKVHTTSPITYDVSVKTNVLLTNV